MNICESITVSARLFPQNTALVFRGESISYQQLDDLSQAAADVLQSHGVSPGDRVAIQIGNCPAFPVWYYAVLRVGGIAVSISTRLATKERDFIIEDSGAKVLMSDQPIENDPVKGLSNGLEACWQVSADGRFWNQTELDVQGSRPWHDSDPDQPALILYTSGTTGFPKGATLSHANVRSNVAAFNHLCGMRTGDRVLLAVPLFHCFGQNALLNSVLNVGGTLVLQEQFDLNESRKLIVENQVNQLYGVPMMFQLLLESCRTEDLETVDYCFSAAAPLSIQTSQRWTAKFGMPIHEGYGLTETSPFASYNHRNRFQEGSIGMAIDGVEMRILDPDSGLACAPNQLGEIAIRGPNVMLGYWNRPEDTKDAFRDDWFRSGDIGKQDELGFFYIVDRVKDMIAVGGMKVFPAEVERVLRDVDGVVDAAVVGIEDSVMGEQVIGFVKPDPEPDETISLEKIVSQAKQELASYKVPRRVFAIDELPRNPSGKVLKTQLRDKARELVTQTTASAATGNSLTAGLPSSSRPDDNQRNDKSEDKADASDHSQGLLDQPAHRMLHPSLTERIKAIHPAQQLDAVSDALCELVVKLLDTSDSPDRDLTFLEMGMDSLMIVEMGTQVQLELNPDENLPATLLFDYPRVDDLAGFILNKFHSSESTDKVGSSDPANEEFGSTDTKGESKLKQEVENLSEEEALAQLLKELEQA